MDIDYLIVGQGLAGTLLSHFLLQARKKILVVDDGNPAAASKVCLGLMNPIMGRKMKRAWKVAVLFPFAKKTYQEIGQQFGKQLYWPKTILRIFLDEKQKKLWDAKKDLPEYAPYLAKSQNCEPYAGKISLEPGYVKITGSGYVLVRELLSQYRQFLCERDYLRPEKLDPTEITIRHGKVQWRDITAGKIIFCEGHKGRFNSYFKELPFSPTKGETLTIKAKGLPDENIIHKGIFLLPLGGEAFKVGATHNWNDLSESFTENGRNELWAKLTKLLHVPFEEVSFHAGVRPALLDRKPVLGLHPAQQEIGIYNGLGAKGVSMGPYLAKQFADYLEKKSILDAEVNIERFG